ncbi:hypothetical protein ACR6C2_43825 [Streptomyces sp. INA 01156]
MSEALAAGGPVPVALSSIVSTLSAPAVSQLTYEHVSALVTEVLVVPDREAVQGSLDLADHAKVWTEPVRAVRCRRRAGCWSGSARGPGSGWWCAGQRDHRRHDRLGVPFRAALSPRRAPETLICSLPYSN